MSLGRFLAAGKSLIGMKDMDSRYRMTSKNLLPKFGSERNPFGRSSITEPIKGEAVRSAATPELPRTVPLETSTVLPVTTEPKELNTVEMMKTTNLTAHAVDAETESMTVSVPAKRNSVKFGPWLKKLNPLAYLSGRRLGAKAIAVKPARTHIQTELSLEKVKVMRNDLSDTDLEFVRAKRKPVEQPKAPQPVLQQPVVVKSEPSTWGRLTSRIFGSEETLIR